MATENVIRITYKELEDLAKQYEDSKRTKDHRQKRPTAQIYRAGVSRLTSKSDESTKLNNIETTDSIQDLNKVTPKDSAVNETPVLTQTKKKKRPEVALYVPHSRTAGGDAKVIDSNVTKNPAKIIDSNSTQKEKNVTKLENTQPQTERENKGSENVLRNTSESNFCPINNRFKISVVHPSRSQRESDIFEGGHQQRTPEPKSFGDGNRIQDNGGARAEITGNFSGETESLNLHTNNLSVPECRQPINYHKITQGTVSKGSSSVHSYSRQRHRHHSSGSSKSSSQEDDDVNISKGDGDNSQLVEGTVSAHVDINDKDGSILTDRPVLNWATEMEQDETGLAYEYNNPKCTEGSMKDVRNTKISSIPPNVERNYEYNTSAKWENVIRYEPLESNSVNNDGYDKSQINVNSKHNISEQEFNRSQDTDHNEHSGRISSSSDANYRPHSDVAARRSSSNSRRKTRGATSPISDQTKVSKSAHRGHKEAGNRNISDLRNDEQQSFGHEHGSGIGESEFVCSEKRKTNSRHRNRSFNDHEQQCDDINITIKNRGQRQILSRGNSQNDLSNQGRQSPGGLIHLPPTAPRVSSPNTAYDFSYAERNANVRGRSGQQRQLFNPNNPSRPIMVQTHDDIRDSMSSSRHDDARDSMSSHVDDICDSMSSRRDDARDARSDHDNISERNRSRNSESDAASDRKSSGYQTPKTRTRRPSQENAPVDGRFGNDENRSPNSNNRIAEDSPTKDISYHADSRHSDNIAASIKRHPHDPRDLPKPSQSQPNFPRGTYQAPYPGFPQHDGMYQRQAPPANVYFYNPYFRQPLHPPYPPHNAFYNNYPAVSYEFAQPQPRMMAEHVLCEAMLIDTQLTAMVARRNTDPDYFQRLDVLRYDLRGKYELILLNDADFAMKHSIDQQLWKSIYYQVIEVLRKILTEQPSAKSYLLAVFDEGTAYYRSLLAKLQNKYGFALDDYINGSMLAPQTTSRSVKLALMSAQRTLICLGDIARYHEQMHDAVDYGKARSWYIKAQQIAPKNGRPYNQLAILAIYTKRKLEAVYYYMRSLAASNPFLTARECLMSLFEEIRKKAESVEKERVEEKERVMRLRRRQEEEGPRVELWIHDDGTSQEDEMIDSYEDDLHRLLPIDLNKRMVLTFLNVHGKLFTKIGMESYSTVSTQLCQELQVLLTHTPLPTDRLLHLLAINMFAIDNTALKNAQGTDSSTIRSVQQEQSVQMSLDLFALVVASCTWLLREHLDSSLYPSRVTPESLAPLLPAIKVWIDWMVCHESLWNPMPTVAKPPDSFMIDVWETVARFCNVVKDVDISHVTFNSDPYDGCEALVLPEDSMMSGFVPLLSAPNDPVYVDATIDKVVACDCLRIQKLQLFSEYLCGVEPPMLAYDVEKKAYYSVCQSSIDAHDSHVASSVDQLHLQDDEVNERASDDEYPAEGDDLSELRRRKRDLQKKVKNQTRAKETIEAILDEHRLKRRLVLEICPTFLVPDTNCFIKHLRQVMKIVQHHKYIIVVPLVVINELDGLCRGCAEGHYDTEHAQSVRTQAQEAVAYLERQFEAGNKYVVALTSKGTTMTTIAFRSEEGDAHGINDDRILECCLHYCQDTARDFMNKAPDEAIRLRRDAVLLTDDRNLRLKAHTKNVPVKAVPEFMTWSKIT